MFGVENTATPPVCRTRKFQGDLPIVFQVLNCFDACNKPKPIIAVRKGLAIQIDRIDLETGRGKQFVRVVAAKGAKRVMRSNQLQQFPSPAADIEVVSAR
jgi:hypothetical protein